MNIFNSFNISLVIINSYAKLNPKLEAITILKFALSSKSMSKNASS